MTAALRFTFTVTGPNEYQSIQILTVSAADNWTGSVTVENLPYGTYRVMETGFDAVPGYTGPAIQPATGAEAVVSKEANGAVTFTNTYTKAAADKGSVKVVKTFEGLPENVRPENVSFEILLNNELVSTLTLANGRWEGSLALDAGTYTVREVLTGLNVNGYVFTGVTPAAEQTFVVEDGKETVVTFANAYRKDQVAVEFNVEKAVNQTGSYLPYKDTDFTFQLKLTGAADTNQLLVTFNGMEVKDGKLTLNLKAGEKSVKGALNISGPAEQMAGLSGTLEEIVPEATGKWTYDTQKYTFTFDGQSLKLYNGSQAAAAQATFTNEYKDDTPRTSLTVNKVWQDKGYEKKRPSSVTVQLYYYKKDSNGKDTKTTVAYKVDGKDVTVTLSDSNSWKYTFENLDARFTWTVKEVKVPSGYSAKVTTNTAKKTATVTNTYGAQPKTGFDGLPLILVMCGVLLAGGAALILVNRKKKPAHKED